LRRAATVFQRLPAPYEAARTARALAQTCAALGDRSSALLELDRAEAAFRDLAAAPDLVAARALRERVAAPAGGPQSGLSPRELEVLALVATGRTNREIAEALVISEHTVGRHLEHIFAKLGVATRTAATAFAYEHGLLATS
jgi:DNA-binding NarL/FixJ family response regulator